MFDGHARYADGNAHFTYRFDIPSDVTGGTLTLDIGNQYLVEVSPDNQTGATVLEATGLTGDTGLKNRAERSLDLNDHPRRQPDAVRARRGRLSAGRLGRLARAREARDAALSRGSGEARERLPTAAARHRPLGRRPGIPGARGA